MPLFKPPSATKSDKRRATDQMFFLDAHCQNRRSWSRCLEVEIGWKEIKAYEEEKQMDETWVQRINTLLEIRLISVDLSFVNMSFS